MELAELSAVTLARMLRTREVSAAEVLAAHLDRIERRNPALNAVVTLVAERAGAAAAAADKAAADGEFLGPLHGLPIAIKDNADTAGIRTTYGSPLMADHVPERDSAYVASLKRAGAIVIGKTNTPEFAAGSQTFNPIFGVTRNPYDLSRTPGGSSGGAAAAVAARLVPFGDGSDLAASVRNPAAFCNVVGLRTTPGLVPLDDADDPFDPLSVVGPIARTPADAALLLAGMCGRDSARPLARPDRPGDFLDLRPVDPRGLRVAWSTDLGGLAVEPAVTEVLAGARAALAAMGCEVVDAEPELTAADEVFQVLRALNMVRLAHLPRERLKDTLAWNIEKGLALGAAEIAAARSERTRIINRMRAFLSGARARAGTRPGAGAGAGAGAGDGAGGGFDLLALPTAQVVPFPVEREWVTEIAGEPQRTYIDWMRTCSRITVTAHPAVSVPAGFTPGGLPVGLQLVAPYGADGWLLRVAQAFTEATGHTEARPREDV
ncbi:MAG TPA: amidase family protein [Streptosporangiaceae bacterium]|nr:amidase family protein [Streptosporangiaceae bacterium]